MAQSPTATDLASPLPAAAAAASAAGVPAAALPPVARETQSAFLAALLQSSLHGVPFIVLYGGAATGKTATAAHVCRSLAADRGSAFHTATLPTACSAQCFLAIYVRF